ncbi:MAG: EamA family transporter [Bradymonadaceae bacterium]
MTALTLGLIIALGSAFFWAALDIGRKHLGRHMSATGAVALLMLLQIPLILPILGLGELLSNSGDNGVVFELLLGGFPDLTRTYFLYAMGSVILNLGANYLFLRSVQISPLSLTTPYLAFTPVFTAFVALFTLGQVPTAWGWAGIGIVCVGAFSMNPGEADGGIWAPFKALWTERGTFYMLIVSLLWSLTPVLDKGAAENSSPLWHTFFLAASVGILFTVARLGKDRGAGKLISELKATPFWLVAGAIFATFALLLQLVSYDFIDVAYVETIKRAVGVTSAIVAGYLLFGERDIWRRLFGALVMCVGVAMILMGG